MKQTDYQRGYVDGLAAYAWWKDGVQYVGTCGSTYKHATERFLVEAGPPPGLHEPDLLEALQGLMWRFADDADPNEPDGICPDILVARAAITKAT